MQNMSEVKLSISVAITGGISSGKSTVLNILKERYHFKVYSADDIVSDLYSKQEIKENLILLFGRNIIDKNNKVNRKFILDNILFYTKQREKLTKYINPIVKNKIKEIISNQKGIFFIEVPLLFELGWEVLFNKVIVLCADKNIRIKRCLHNRKMLYKDVIKILNLQYKNEELYYKADYIMENNFTIKNIEKRLRKILGELLN